MRTEGERGRQYSRSCSHTRSRRGQMPMILISASILLIALHFLSSSAQSACRDPDVARGFGSVAYAAEADATIQYFGHNFFLITTRSGTRIVTDPLGPGWYPTPNIAGHVVTVGREHYNHNYVQLVQGNPVILRGLKNYGAEWNKVSMSVKDIFVYNVPVYQNAASTDAIKGGAFVSIWEHSASCTWAIWPILLPRHRSNR